MRPRDRRPSGVLEAISALPASSATAGGADGRRRPIPAFGLRAPGALALLAVGGLHLEQLVVATFWVIPVIGPLFALNFAGSLVVGLALLSPVERLAGRWGPMLPGLLAGVGLAIAAGGLAFLLVSEVTPIFGFRESNFRPEVVTALVTDVATIVLLGGFLASLARAHRPAFPR
jgi:hypothetical protein